MWCETKSSKVEIDCSPCQITILPNGLCGQIGARDGNDLKPKLLLFRGRHKWTPLSTVAPQDPSEAQEDGRAEGQAPGPQRRRRWQRFQRRQHQTGDFALGQRLRHRRLDGSGVVRQSTHQRELGGRRNVDVDHFTHQTRLLGHQHLWTLHSKNLRVAAFRLVTNEFWSRFSLPFPPHLIGFVFKLRFIYCTDLDVGLVVADVIVAIAGQVGDENRVPRADQVVIRLVRLKQVRHAFGAALSDLGRWEKQKKSESSEATSTIILLTTDHIKKMSVFHSFMK